MKKIYILINIALFAFTNQSLSSEAGMPQLNTDFWSAQIFWLLIIFSFLYIIIWKVFLPKITYSLENRKSKIVNDLNEAQKLKESAEKKFNEYQKIIDDSKKEAQKIIEDDRKKLEKNINEKKQKFNEEIEKELMAVEKEIKDSKKNSLPSISAISAEITTDVIKKIINVEVNKSNAAAIIEDIAKRKMEKTYDN